MGKRLNMNINFRKISMFLLTLYTITLFIFTYDSTLNQISRIIFGLLLITIMLNLLTSKPIIFDSMHVCLFLLLLLSLLSLFWSISFELAFVANITFIQLVILAFMIRTIIVCKEDVELLLKSICFGGVLMCLYTISVYGIANLLNILLTNGRVGGIVNQENAFGFYAAIAFIISLYYALYKNKKFNYIVSAFLLTFSLISGSRKALLVLFLGTLLLIYFNEKGFEKYRRWLLFSVLITALIYIVPTISLFDSSSIRWQSFINFLDGSGEVDASIQMRQEMVKFGIEMFFEKPLLGHGAEQYRQLFNLRYGIIKTSHNNYIQILVSYGIVGFSLYYGMYLYIIYFLYKGITCGEKTAVVLFSITITMLLSDITSVTLYGKLTYVILSVNYAYITILQKRNVFCLKHQESIFEAVQTKEKLRTNYKM